MTDRVRFLVQFGSESEPLRVDLSTNVKSFFFSIGEVPPPPTGEPDGDGDGG